MVLIDQWHLCLSYLNVDCSYGLVVEPDNFFFFLLLFPMGVFVMAEVSCSNVSRFVAFIMSRHSRCPIQDVLKQDYSDFLNFLQLFRIV